VHCRTFLLTQLFGAKHRYRAVAHARKALRDESKTNQIALCTEAN